MARLDVAHSHRPSESMPKWTLVLGPTLQPQRGAANKENTRRHCWEKFSRVSSRSISHQDQRVTFDQPTASLLLIDEPLVMLTHETPTCTSGNALLFMPPSMVPIKLSTQRRLFVLSLHLRVHKVCGKWHEMYHLLTTCDSVIQQAGTTRHGDGLHQKKYHVCGAARCQKVPTSQRT